MAALNEEAIHALSTEVLERCTLKDGKLTLDEQSFVAFGERIKNTANVDDKRGWGTAMIALCNRLRGVPGAGPAAERVLALAAIALGDQELNAMIGREAAKSKR